MQTLRIKNPRRFECVTNVAFVACCKTKLDHPAPAKDLYQSSLFTLTRRYVEREIQKSSFHGWFILSALHGVVEPDQVLEPYDVSLASMNKKGREEWSVTVLKQINHIWKRPEWNRFTVFAGMFYCNPFYSFNQCKFPCSSLGIGERLAFLKSSLGEIKEKKLEQTLLF